MNYGTITEQEVKKRLERFTNIKQVYLYGAGRCASGCMEYLLRKDISVLGVIDSKEELLGHFVGGSKIISYEDYERNGKGPILISSRDYVPEIMCNHMENEEMLSFFVWYDCINSDEYSKLNLIDERSYQVLECMRNSDCCGTVALFQEVVEQNQYFSLYPFFGGIDETFVDLGAFGGDTIERFLLSQTPTMKGIYAFEPGKEQLEGLSERVARLNREWILPKNLIKIIPYGVSAKSGEFFYEKSPYEAPSSKIIYSNDFSEQECEKVKVVSVDDYFAEIPITFLKADIEGMEYEMIKGAEKVIKRDRPKMAISVYHKPDDLLSIYSMLHKWVPEYKFALRHYSLGWTETILYCYVE